MVDIDCEQSLCLTYCTTSLCLKQKQFKKYCQSQEKKSSSHLHLQCIMYKTYNRNSPIIFHKSRTEQVTVIRHEVHFVIIHFHWIDRLIIQVIMYWLALILTGMLQWNNPPHPNQHILNTWFKQRATNSVVQVPFCKQHILHRHKNSICRDQLWLLCVTLPS